MLNLSVVVCFSGSDGLVKLWTIKVNECVKTFDEHTAKIWGLAVGKKEDVLVTGGADSTVIIWKVCIIWIVIFILSLTANSNLL